MSAEIYTIKAKDIIKTTKNDKYTNKVFATKDDIINTFKEEIIIYNNSMTNIKDIININNIVSLRPLKYAEQQIAILDQAIFLLNSLAESVQMRDMKLPLQIDPNKKLRIQITKAIIFN